MKILKALHGEESVVDDDVYDWAKNKNWHVNNYGYFVTGGGNYKKLLHRLIIGDCGDYDIDHKNGCKLDNLKANLRLSTRAENTYNQGRRLDNTSGFRGVWYRKDRKVWAAEIKKDGVKYSLGCYKTPKEAAIAYNYKAKELFGEYANLNEI